MYKQNKTGSRIVTSYGAIDEISHFLAPEKFILLQALNKFTYQVAISRAQMRIILRQHFMFTSNNQSELKHTIFVISEGKNLEARRVKHKSLDFWGTKTVCIKNEIIGIREISQVTFKVSRIFSNSPSIQTLEPLPIQSANFSVANFQN